MSLYQVDVAHTPENSSGIKVLRQAGKMRLADATALHRWLLQHHRGTVLAGVDQPVAEHLATALRQAGFNASVQPSSVLTPTSFAPLGHKKFIWGPMRTLSEAD